MADNYQDLAIKRQVLLERIKSGQFRDFNKAFKEIEQLIRSAFIELDDEFESLSRRKLERFIQDLKEDQIKVFSSYMDDFAIGLSGIAQLTQEQELEALGKFIDLRGTKLAKFTKIDLQRAILKRPLSVNGDLLASWQKDFTQIESKRVSDVIRLAWSQGETNQQAVRHIIGTKANGYKDGILNTSRRNASTVVRTSVQHVASSARMEIWQKNSKVVRGYEWLSTLDRKTSSQCKSLDGRKFEFGKGPIPPIHPNCRSTTVPVTNPKYDFLDEGATRSAEFGPVSAKDNYYDWLKKQDRQTVVDALGEKRAKLFLDGGLSPARFRDLQFDRNFEPLTLDEMKAKEPNAFKKAFGDSAPVTPRKRDKSQKTTKKVGNQSPQPKTQKPPSPPEPKPTREPIVEGVTPSERVSEIREKMSKIQVSNVLKSDGKGWFTSRKLQILKKKMERAKKENKKFEVNRIWDEIYKTENEIKGRAEKARSEALEALALATEQQGDPKQIIGKVTKDFKDEFGERLAKMATFVSRIVHKDILPNGLEFKLSPAGQGSYYQNGKVSMQSGAADSVLAHEIVHDLEIKNASILRKTERFLEKRAAGQPVKDLGDLRKSRLYKGIKVYEDEWEKKGGSHYTGRLYAWDGTEILSTAVERLFNNPIAFAEQDPEFFEFVLSIFQDV